MNRRAWVRRIRERALGRSVEDAELAERIARVIAQHAKEHEEDANKKTAEPEPVRSESDA